MTKLIKYKKNTLGPTANKMLDDKTFRKAKKFKTKKTSKIYVTNEFKGIINKPVVINREGMNDKTLSKVLRSTGSTRQQKDSAIAAYMWEQGKENASFLAELYVSKGAHTKETRAFKSQMRFDYEVFVNFFIQLLYSMSDTMKGGPAENVLYDLSKLLKDRAEMLADRVKRTTEDRLKDNGYGIYVDRNGKAYSVFDEDLDEAIAKDKKHNERNRDSK